MRDVPPLEARPPAVDHKELMRRAHRCLLESDQSLCASARVLEAAAWMRITLTGMAMALPREVHPST